MRRRLLLTRRVAGVLCVLLAASGAVGLLAIASFARHTPAPPPRFETAGEVYIEGMRTVVYEANGQRLNASARSLRFEPAHTIGPFRLGFLRSVVASDVEIELLAPTADRSLPLDLASYVKDTGNALFRQIGGITSAELRGLTITRRDDSGTLTLLRARLCRTDARTRAMACWKGVLRDGNGLSPFGEAVHDGRRWRITKAVPR